MEIINISSSQCVAFQNIALSFMFTVGTDGRERCLISATKTKIYEALHFWFPAILQYHHKSYLSCLAKFLFQVLGFLFLLLVIPDPDGVANASPSEVTEPKPDEPDDVGVSVPVGVTVSEEL